MSVGGRRVSPELLEAVQRVFPVQGRTETRQLELALADIARPFGERNGLVVRLIVFEIDAAGTMSIRDVKEQEVFFPEAPDERAIPFLEGWARVAGKVLTTYADVEILMPHDILRTDALTLVTATTADDFERALMMKSRLGGMIR